MNDEPLAVELESLAAGRLIRQDRDRPNDCPGHWFVSRRVTKLLRLINRVLEA